MRNGAGPNSLLETVGAFLLIVATAMSWAWKTLPCQLFVLTLLRRLGYLTAIEERRMARKIIRVHLSIP